MDTRVSPPVMHKAPMWTPERHERIIALLHQRQRLTTDAFAAELGVSKETIRRDLIELEHSGKLSRVHGGAVPCNTAAEASYAERTALFLPEKRAIAAAAAGLIAPGQSCFIDAGSTTHALAQALQNARDLLIVTNSVDVANSLRGRADLQVHLLGGCMASDVPATYGDFTLGEIARFRMDWAITSPTALHPEQGAMDYDWQEAAVARAMIAQAGRTILLADANKLGGSSRVLVCNSQSIDCLVTDARADAASLERLSRAGIKRIVQAELA